MRLHTRVLLAQLPALLVILVLVVWGGHTVTRLGAESQKILAENYRSVDAAERMKEALARQDTAALLALAGDIQGAAAMSKEQRPLFEAALRAQEANITEPGEAEIVARLRAAWAAHQAAYDHLVAAPPEGLRPVYFEQVQPAFLAAKAEAQAVLTLNQDAMREKSAAAAARATTARRAWILGAAVGLAAAVLLGGLLSRRLTVPLGTLARTAARVGDGELDVHLPRTGVLELDALAETFDTMAARLLAFRTAGESELARARDSAQAAIESLVDPVLVLTPDGALRATNGAARRALGTGAAGPPFTPADPALAATLARVRDEVVRTGLPVLPADFSAVVLVPTDTGERAFLPLATPIREAGSAALIGVTVLLQDVTRLRRLDTLKGDLILTAAHELRTPLTSLGMALHLALDERVSGPVGDTRLPFLTAAQEDVTRLRALVEDLLDLSRIQEGRLVLRRADVAPAALLAEAREWVRAAADAAGVNVVVEDTLALPTISADPRRMHLALANLAGNAVRYAPRGSAVRLRALATPGGVRFEVDDAGPGVPLAERDHIFDAFVRGTETEGPGAGLGLYIAREVTRAHGGRLGVTDAPPTGARFYLELPAAPSA